MLIKVNTVNKKNSNDENFIWSFLFQYILNLNVLL